MEPPVTAPWRVVEAVEPVAGPSEPDREQGALWPRGVVAVGVALTVALALGAFLIAGSGPQPVVSVGLAASPDVGGSGETQAVGSPGTTEMSADLLVVDVGGAVLNPGLYRLSNGSRVADALAAAGGYGPRVDTARAAEAINLAERLTDGAKVRVPSRDDPPAAGATAGAPGSSGGGPPGPIDLNAASAAQLDSLPGIGPVTAAKIIAARERRPFRSVNELRDRKLVGQATFAKLEGLVTVR